MSRVAFIVPAVEGSVSGPRNSVTLLARALNRYTEFKTDVFSPRCTADFEFNGVRVWAFDAKGQLELLRNYDVVVFSGVWLPENLRIAHYLRRCRIPYLISPRSSLMRSQFSYSSYKKWPFLLLGGYQYVRGATAIHFLSDDEKMASYFNRWGVVVSNALPEEMFVHQATLNSTKTFGFLGRYVLDHKGLDILIEALKLVADDMRAQGWVMKFRGTDNRGELNAILRLREQYQLEDVLEIGDGAYGNEKIAFLEQVDVFVHTSRYEGQPQAVMEAMSRGCAILVCPGANMGEATDKGQAGLNVALDAQSIADGLDHFMHNPQQLEQYRQQARRYAQAHYSPQAVADQFVSMLNEQLTVYSK